MSPGLWHHGCCCGGGVGELYILTVTATGVVLARWDGTAFSNEILSPTGGISVNSRVRICYSGYDSVLRFVYRRTDTSKLWYGEGTPGSWTYAALGDGTYGDLVVYGLGCARGRILVWTSTGIRREESAGSWVLDTPSYEMIGTNSAGAGISADFGYEYPRLWIPRRDPVAPETLYANNGDLSESIASGGGYQFRYGNTAIDSAGDLWLASCGVWDTDSDITTVRVYKRLAANSWDSHIVEDRSCYNDFLVDHASPFCIGPDDRLHLRYNNPNTWRYAVSEDAGATWICEDIGNWDSQDHVILLVDSVGAPAILKQTGCQWGGTPSQVELYARSSLGVWSVVGTTDIDGIDGYVNACSNWSFS